MMFILYFLNVACSAGQSALTKLYAARGGESGRFNICKLSVAFVVFVVISAVFGFAFHPPTLLFGAVYGVFLCLSMYTGFKALSLGPMSLTSIISSFSLIIPVAVGIIFWDERLSVLGTVGIIALLAAIVVLNYKRGGRANIRWLTFSVLTLLANGICSVVQKMHQRYFPKHYTLEFMAAAMLTALVLLLLKRLVSGAVGQRFGFTAVGALSGIMNGIANYIVLLLSAGENASVLFPIVSAANTAAVWLVGRVYFREKLMPLQVVGLVLGIIAVLLLKIG